MLTMDMPLSVNILGFISLMTYVITLIPTNLKIVFPHTKETGIPQFLLKYRRSIGIIAFFFALGHSFLLVKKRNLDFLDLKTFWIYIQGITTLTIFSLLAITSNNWSIKKLKRNWKKLHQMTYFAIFLLIWHILDKMSGHWTYLTPIGIAIITGITILFLIRLWIIYQDTTTKNKRKITKLNN
ncbi:ferric reductase-like transmembrane domain-containing protein [Nostoc sp. CHAB 5836]|uniref:ferric reductase-like transmembrane domain-containing protein n=1 Tax=Nostoc sp. CHAB 5836 TaxID=2780404 RepID=UPI001E290D18|nr:ferric reductase-like transmembrane domain-containing protein [Nostoc sp. CHAB 5836]MCC5617644.1 ferric reductase-like transmembrane domain-containing protein [Nostoc sp. CHAB 5836]